MRYLTFVLIPTVLFLLPRYGQADWVQQNSGTTRNLNFVQFPVDALTGYAVGVGGVIRKTTDGGANWDSLTSGTSTGLWSVHFPAGPQGVEAGREHAEGKKKGAGHLVCSNP